VTVADSALATTASDQTLLYDARRGLSYVKPVLRGWLHLVWFEVSLVVGTLVLARAHGAGEVTSVAIYTTSVTSLFGTSALYHRGNWGPCWKRRLQRADHAMIFLLIAGTATPAYVLAAPEPYRAVCLVALWALTLLVMLARLLWMNAPEKLVGAVFLALGWTAGLAIPFVWLYKGVAPALLLTAGGMLYTVGAVGYYHRRPDPVPNVFGYHEVFHAYVCAAAACQYVAITLYIV
jgi:hemolysin III